MPSPGEMLSDNIVLEREIGQGGMGAVWIAKNAALGTEVAVKLLRSMGGDVPMEARKRFEAEARGLAQLDHPNLVRIFDFGISPDGDPFIVMELLRGEDLGKRLARGPLDVETTANVLKQTCRALGRAHDAGVIHRDIKPANIFLAEADGELVVKVLDFGVARFGDAALDMSTKTGALIGTPFFMSPEQHMNPKGIDHRADLWSVAVVAYVCLTGELPFKGETITSLGVAILDGKRAPVRAKRPELPMAIDVWMDRALSKDPAQRYPTAKELADAFDRARAASANHAPASAGPASLAATAGAASLQPSGASASFGASAASHAPPMGGMNAPSFAVASTQSALAPPAPPTSAPPAWAPPTAPGPPSPAGPIIPPVVPGAPRKSSSGVIVAAVLGVAALLALGGGAWLFVGRGAAPDAPAASSGKTKSKHSPAASARDDATGDAPAISANAAVGPPSTANAPSAPATTATAGTTALAPATNATGFKPSPTASQAPAATAHPSAVASATPAATRSGAPASGVMSSCWRGNADKGTPASSASTTFQVDANGKTSQIVVTGPARSVGAFTACTVQGIAGLNFGPGSAEQVSASATFPAVK